MAGSPSILLIGAGELGTAVLEALSKHPKRNGGKIAILLRQSTVSSQGSEKKRQIEYLQPLGASFEVGDLADASITQLAEVFKRYHTVISCSGFGLPSVRTLLRAQQKTDWVIVSTVLFMSFLFLPAFGVVDLKERRLRALGSWDAKLSLTTARDIGRVAVEIAYDPRDASHQVVYIAGDTVTYSQVAELVQRRYGGKWTKELWDERFLKKMLEERPDDGMLKYTNKTLNGQRGIELQGLESYLREMPDLE
ncbi:NAD(P)-binding protein [Hypoxylon sp. FL0890]|nr:NAD(P)-binding protein [Hypoxylon sp. FL0890]